MKLDQKKQIVDDLHERFSRSKMAILCDYKGLNVKQLNELRGKLRENEIEFRVVKNSLLKRASQDTDVAFLEEYFKGPSAIAISYRDPVAPAKVLTKFADENQNLEIRAGVLHGRILNTGDVKVLSALPSREVLLGQLLSVLNNVPAGFVRLLGQVPRGLLNVLVAIKDQKAAA